jgi:hypothetical protein
MMMQTSLTDCLILWHQKTHLLSANNKKGSSCQASKQASSVSPVQKSAEFFYILLGGLLVGQTDRGKSDC